MPLRDEHEELLATATRMTAELDAFYERLESGDVMHVQHYEFAMRARWLSYVLNGSLSLIDDDAYPSAFAVLRSGLEHHIIDLLLFLGDRYQQVFSGVSATDWREYQKARADNEDWTRNILDWTWQSGTLKVVRSGPHFNDAGGTLSVYYGFLSNFDPFRGPPEEQQYLTTDFMEAELHERWSRKQQGLYSEGLQWKRLKENLAINRLFDEKQLAQLNVHFRFLSAFVHPVSEAYTLLYGSNTPAKSKAYDHFASELVLLYVNILGVRELRALQLMTTHEPTVGIRGVDDLDGRVTEAERVSEPLWFPGGTPHEFDRVQEANHRGLVDGHHVPVGTPGRLRPEEIADDEVRYYRNPLVRLRKMHHSVNEMTGFPYVSPWPRADAGPF